jgi:hypothetical protein
MRVLFAAPTVRPVDLGIAGGTPVFQQAQIYLTIAPPEAPRVLNDFWSTMRLPWRPAIQLIATAPLDLLQDSAAMPLMTTLLQRAVLLDGSGAVDERIQIGGWVLKDADSSPIVGATVQHLSIVDGAVLGQTLTDDAGRFIFTDLSRGTQRLRASGAGLGPLQRDLNLPAETPDTHVFRLT